MKKIFVVTLLGAFLFPLYTQAATLVVNTSDPNGVGEDLAADGSKCTFSEAFSSIQNAALEVGCTNSVPSELLGTNDTIHFSVPTIELSEAISSPTPARSLIIDGESNGINVVVSGAGGIGFYGPITVSLTLRKLNFTGSTTQTNLIFANAPSFTMDNCSFLGMNGVTTGMEGLLAISSSVATINNSRFENNSLSPSLLVFPRDGVISVFQNSLDVLTIENSSFSANSSGAVGGVITSIGTSGQIMIKNSSFYNNASTKLGSVINKSGGSIVINNSTIYENRSRSGGVTGLGGAIVADGTNVLIKNSIVAKNVDGPLSSEIASDCKFTMSTTLNSASSHNIVSVSGASTGCFMENSVLDNQVLSGFTLPAEDPVLHLHPLSSANIEAIDHGDNATCESIDQRSTHRPLGAACDIGAYEFTPSTFAFSAATATVNEGDSVVLTVNRAGSTDGAVALAYSSSGALTSVSGTLNWANLDGAAKTITIPIPVDSITQGDRTFTVTLGAVTPRSLGFLDRTNVVVVTIHDVSSATATAGTTTGGGSAGTTGGSGTAGSTTSGTTSAGSSSAGTSSAGTTSAGTTSGGSSTAGSTAGAPVGSEGVTPHAGGGCSLMPRNVTVR